jgi:hypothetical protein
MAEIATTDAYGLYTKKLIAVYREKIGTTNFLRSFFTVEETITKELAIMVERNNEMVAVDVARGSDGNRNQWSWTSERIYVPPYFKEYFDITNLQLYDRLFGAAQMDDAAMAALIFDTVEKTMELQKKVERAIERQCAQIFIDGIVTLKNGVHINYKRQGDSMVDPGAGQYFANAIDPYALFEAGCVFMRKEGKATGAVFNAIVGTEAWLDLLNNTKFKERQNFFHMQLDQVTGPQRNNNTGANLMGKIVCGSYIVQIWTYEQYYNDPDNNNELTQYIDPKMVVMLPTDGTSFKIGFAAIPQLVKPGQTPRKGQFLVRDYVDEKAQTHEIILESAPLAIPVSVDRIYTFRGKAA